MTLRALIFDVDGTLAETESEGHLPAFNAAFREAGLSWHWSPERYGELLRVTGGKERLLHFAQQEDQAFAAQPDVAVRIGALHQAKTRHYVQAVVGGAVTLRPGIARLIGKARATGLRLAIATTTTPENVTALLRASLAADAEGWFEVIGAGDVVPAKKPAPDIYQWVLGRLGLAAADCLALEDSANGLRSALEAGVPTVITANRYTVGEDFTGALAVLPNLSGVTLDQLAAYHSRTYSQDKKL